MKLINRHWEITDAVGNIEIVDGPGVVGQQPVLNPGESFEYNSFCPLPTEFGIMVGYYEMENENGNQFNAEIPTFKLISPQSIN